MRISNSVLSVLVLAAASLTACGQNPHVLGQDPSINGTVRGPTANPGDNGQGKGEGKGDGKDNEPCVRTTVTYVPARPLHEDEIRRSENATTFFATDVILPARDAVTELQFVLLAVSSSSVDRAANGDHLCLTDLNRCADVGGRTLARLDLQNIFEGLDWLDTLYKNGTVRWSAPSSWNMSNALLQVAVTEDHCQPKDDGKGDKGGKDDGKGGKDNGKGN